MIEMLHTWVRESTECTWDTMEKVLKDMNETDLAGTIQHYTRELLRIEGEQRNHNAQCKRLVPLKHQCYEDWWLKQLRFEEDSLSLLHDPTMTTAEITRCLDEDAAQWDEIGIALEMSKGQLDKINEDYQGCVRKLKKVIATWLSENFDHSWRLLINTLIELGWTKTAEKVEDTATKLRKKKENDTSYLDSTSHTIALLFSAQRARQVTLDQEFWNMKRSRTKLRGN